MKKIESLCGYVKKAVTKPDETLTNNRLIVNSTPQSGSWRENESELNNFLEEK
jgi:hypothetical protein